MSRTVQAQRAISSVVCAFVIAAVLASASPLQAATHQFMNMRHARPTAAAAAPAADRAAIAARQADSNEQFRNASLSDITANAWRHYLSLPIGIANDIDSVNCDVAQRGEFWYLSPPFGQDSTTTCTIPAGKSIVGFVAAYISNNCPGDFDGSPVPKAQDFLGDYATAIVDTVVGPAAELDHQRIRVRRVVSNVFAFTAGADWTKIPGGCFMGSPQIAVSDGYFVFIPPLPRGKHVLTLSVADPATTGTFYIKVR